MIRVAIANDTLIALSALRRVIATNSAYELIWSARDGHQAVALCERDTPDIMLMDLRMPGLDGVEATQEIMARAPCAILIVTGSIRHNTSKIFEAMGYGALDVVATPVLGALNTDDSIQAAAKPLLDKMATVTAFIGKSVRRNKTSPFSPRSPDSISHLPPLVVIGASTGGPGAIAYILKELPATFPAAVVIVQHIDQQFTLGLAQWLNNQSSLPVRVAQEGDKVRSHQVYISSGGSHLVMGRDQTLHYVSSEFKTPYRPSIDIFFNSIAQHWLEKGQAVLLTGMGKDGAAGLSALRSAHWQTVAQSEESCVVYGMPKAAVEMNAASEVLSIHQIPQRLIEALSCRRP